MFALTLFNIFFVFTMFQVGNSRYTGWYSTKIYDRGHRSNDDGGHNLGNFTDTLSDGIYRPLIYNDGGHDFLTKRKMKSDETLNGGDDKVITVMLPIGVILP